MSTTPPSATRSAGRTRAPVSQRASMVDPEQLHRSDTTLRAGTPRWPPTEGETTSSPLMPRDAVPAHRLYFRLLAMASPQLDTGRNLLL
jgi:hypothetical protein